MVRSTLYLIIVTNIMFTTLYFEMTIPYIASPRQLQFIKHDLFRHILLIISTLGQKIIVNTDIFYAKMLMLSFVVSELY